MALTEVRREYNKAYYAAHREEMRESARVWGEAHPEYSKEYYASHREEMLAKSHAWQREHAEANREHSQRWRKKNHERCMATASVRSKVRRARKCGVYAESVRASEIFERDGWRCQLCGCETLRFWERCGGVIYG